jgi:hypothetical protein
MNGYYALLWMASVVAVLSIPFVLFALLMRLVGRIGNRSLIIVLAMDSIFWVAAVFFWSILGGD